VFISFPGTKKVFRLDENGNPHTDDKNLLVFDLEDYRKILADYLRKEDEMANAMHKVGGTLGCNLTRYNGTHYIGRYDYFGDLLVRSYGLGDVKAIIEEADKEWFGIKKCAELYWGGEELMKKGK